ncbi:MAG: hypothetical protein O3A46_06175 [Candidatus Poribacteria bacterium]|nr:hypothetical protein [Candidatus Poribacteria bacterium]
MNLQTVLEKVWKPAPRSRRIRRERIGKELYVSCPMVEGFMRKSGDCAKCEFNVGEQKRGARVVQLCGHGVKAPRQVPAWIVRLSNWFKKLPLPQEYVSARFQWQRRGARPVSKIKRRHQERVRKQELKRADRRRARDLRTKTRDERHRRQAT